MPEKRTAESLDLSAADKQKLLDEELLIDKNPHPELLIRQNSYGRCVIANREFQPGEVVTTVRGITKTFKDHPFTQRPFLFFAGRTQWTNPFGYARYMNYSCDPNCKLVDRIELVAIKTITPGEEATWGYELEAKSSELAEDARWDHAWTFRCLCGAPNCKGLIDKNS